MEFNGWGGFEDLVKACGYSNCNKNSSNASESNNNNNNNNNSCNMGCNDIPGGFQCVNPELFIVIGEVLGNIIAGSIPYNVQNAVGNWLELVGQAILTYNSQQQYFQSGPGRYFDPINYNVSNSFCSTNSTNNNENANSSNNNTNSSNKNKKKKPNSSSDAKSIEYETSKLEELELQINQLTAELEMIKNMINK